MLHEIPLFSIATCNTFVAIAPTNKREQSQIKLHDYESVELPNKAHTIARC